VIFAGQVVVALAPNHAAAAMSAEHGADGGADPDGETPAATAAAS